MGEVRARRHTNDVGVPLVPSFMKKAGSFFDVTAPYSVA